MKRKSKRETIGWVIALAAVPFVAFVAVSIWAYGYSYRYKEFKDDLARDFAYAQANDCLTATENDVSTRLTSRNSDYIWREIAEGEFAGYKEDAMEEPVIELDFGNGSRLRICAAPDADPDTRSVNVRLEREGEVRSIRVNGVRLLNIERLISVQWGNESA